MHRIKQIFAAIVLASGFTATSSQASPILWIDDASGHLGTVDVATGNVTVIGSMGVVMTDIAFDPTGILYGISFSSLYRINTETAASTLVGNTGISSNSLVFGADGTLYTASRSLYTLNPSTGTATLIGNGGTAYNSSGDLAFIGNDLYLSSVSADYLMRLDRTTGVATYVGSIGVGAVYGMATNNNVDLYGVAGTSILSINTATGAGSTLLNYAGHGLGAAYGTSFIEEAAPAVPLPAAAWLFGSGLLGMIGIARTKMHAGSTH
ncbi:MAG: hypothetical protein HY941_04495 [Gammaproteobacteria bacterium]|nr:hypothetical protein [Gammaproteobacteria bacterium]